MDNRRGREQLRDVEEGWETAGLMGAVTLTRSMTEPFMLLMGPLVEHRLPRRIPIGVDAKVRNSGKVRDGVDVKSARRAEE